MSMILYLRRASDEDIARIESDPESTAAFFFAETAHADGDLIDFDKAWQAVHFTLSGSEYESESPLGAMLSQGRTIGIDLGYGQPWIITSDRMRAFSEALSAMTDDDIRQRYDPAAMVTNDVYIADAFADEPEEGLHYLMQGIPALRRFANKCAETGSCALVAIS
ncbi:MAG: YfbM family protein [Pseudomonadota bacterium]